MKKGWIWAVLLVALLAISACRPAADDAGHNASEAAEDLGICQPEDEACVDESALSATPEAETATAEEPAPEETVDETPADANTEVPEIAPPPANPFAVRETDWVMGAEDAFITIIEYADYQ
jgi:hypothetical protein